MALSASNTYNSVESDSSCESETNSVNEFFADAAEDSVVVGCKRQLRSTTLPKVNVSIKGKSTKLPKSNKKNNKTCKNKNKIAIAQDNLPLIFFVSTLM